MPARRSSRAGARRSRHYPTLNPRPKADLGWLKRTCAVPTCRRGRPLALPLPPLWHLGRHRTMASRRMQQCQRACARNGNLARLSHQVCCRTAKSYRSRCPLRRLDERVISSGFPTTPKRKRFRQFRPAASAWACIYACGAAPHRSRRSRGASSPTWQAPEQRQCRRDRRAKCPDFGNKYRD